jgi:hypothetical protein
MTSHLGRFCTIAGEDGNDILPAANSSAALCNVQAPREYEAVTQGMAKTPRFEEALQDIQTRYGDRIRIDIRTAGNRLPLKTYPTLTPEMTAGDWNAIALANHRVDIQLAPIP